MKTGRTRQGNFFAWLVHRTWCRFTHHHQWCSQETTLPHSSTQYIGDFLGDLVVTCLVTGVFFDQVEPCWTNQWLLVARCCHWFENLRGSLTALPATSWCLAVLQGGAVSVGWLVTGRHCNGYCNGSCWLNMVEPVEPWCNFHLHQLPATSKSMQVFLQSRGHSGS